jgi:hypothetical protein
VPLADYPIFSEPALRIHTAGVGDPAWRPDAALRAVADALDGAGGGVRSARI